MKRLETIYVPRIKIDGYFSFQSGELKVPIKQRIDPPRILKLEAKS